MNTSPRNNWPARLFNKSVLKQRKFKEVTNLLGPTNGLTCLDIGSDNGVISYLLRQRGGNWKSADLDGPSVKAIKALVETDVYQLNGGPVPFANNKFDSIAIVDFLEHIPNDASFVSELHRILKPGGTLIINVPHIKNSLLRKFRLAIGQTDEEHGHLRPGYTTDGIRELLGSRFEVENHKTYSKFFSELIDTLIVFAVSLLKGKNAQESKKGILVTGEDLNKGKSMFLAYSVIYPLVWLVSKLDTLLFFSSGYMLVLKAKVQK